ncbi:ABC transporter ATP-binding protein [Caldilinea sp.]|uniref:ABC transporter ATP-binding protein n=1 Tax=Caldilinea sp. TaxID=2293560 RepID=UPI002CA555B6|nr:ABC transporter ATP-binding protein [Caldilinea sp.]HRA67408.1 ABC transporter ATP-binding protein [Caldilinea sp.]
MRSDSLAPAAIALLNVTKCYGAFAAVSDLDLTVPAGEVLGFLGPNGAGKTTTIRLLLGFLRPSAGAVQLLGHDMADPAAALQARGRLGFVPDVAGLDLAATGLWLLDDLARLQRRPPIDRDRLVDALELRRQDLRRPMGRLSRGTRQKINIVQGMQHRPDLLILDEPTEGLDPLAKRALFGLLRELHGRGATIFFSSHVLSEVEDLCDRVALIRGGRLVAVDRIADLRSQMQRRVTVQLDEDAAAHAAQLAALPTVTGLTRLDGRWQFLTGDLPATLRLLATLPVADVAIEPPSLEDIFLRYYRPEPARDA